MHANTGGVASRRLLRRMQKRLLQFLQQRCWMERLRQQLESVSSASEHWTVIGSELGSKRLPREQQQARFHANLLDLQRQLKSIFVRHEHISEEDVWAELRRSGKRILPRVRS